VRAGTAEWVVPVLVAVAADGDRHVVMFGGEPGGREAPVALAAVDEDAEGDDRIIALDGDCILTTVLRW